MYDKARQDALRRLWKLCHRQYDAAIRRYCDRTGDDFQEVSDSPWAFDNVRLPHFPTVLDELVCGARTRRGTPCKNRNLFPNGRCKYHGGASTGPRTEQGKQKVTLNLPNQTS
ncbi:MAG: hypothetical protein LBR82_00515 [Desulfovibrio sp.]|jgi:hypothetical protein|nr:hypothetical protein [Desulfovibrio sp.]